MEDSQYQKPLATAASNEVGPLFVRDIARAVGLADDAEMDDVMRAVQSLQARATEAARKLRQSICVYCGEAGEHESPEARVLAMTDHTLACPKRPEQRLFAIIDGLRADVGTVVSEMDAYVLDEDRCGSDEEEYEALSAGLLPKWCDRIRNLLGQVYAINGIRQGADSAGSGVPRTVDGRSRDPQSPHSLPVSTVQALIDQPDLRTWVQHLPTCEFNWRVLERHETSGGRYLMKRVNGQIRHGWDHMCGAAGFGHATDVCEGCEYEAEDRDPACSCGLEAALLASPSLPHAQWQPMETAPKDGGLVIALLPSGDVTRIRWVEKYAAWSHVVETIINGIETRDDTSAFMIAEPTHWMPLPASPSLHIQEREEDLPRVDGLK